MMSSQRFEFVFVNLRVPPSAETDALFAAAVEAEK